MTPPFTPNRWWLASTVEKSPPPQTFRLHRSIAFFFLQAPSSPPLRFFAYKKISVLRHTCPHNADEKFGVIFTYTTQPFTELLGAKVIGQRSAREGPARKRPQLASEKQEPRPLSPSFHSRICLISLLRWKGWEGNGVG